MSGPHKRVCIQTWPFRYSQARASSAVTSACFQLLQVRSACALSLREPSAQDGESGWTQGQQGGVRRRPACLSPSPRKVTLQASAPPEPAECRIHLSPLPGKDAERLGRGPYLCLTAENQQLQAPVWGDKQAWAWVPEASPGAHPGPHLCPAPPHLPPTQTGVPGSRQGCPRARPAAELPERQDTYTVRLGSRRVVPIAGEISWGGCPPAPKLRSRRGQAPRVEPQRSQGLSATGFQGGEEERERGGEGRRGGRRRGGRNWETEV